MANDWRMAHAFQLEAAKREIEACTDVRRLQGVALNLMLQVEAHKEMIAKLLLSDPAL
jgi:hypothetical protein